MMSLSRDMPVLRRIVVGRQGLLRRLRPARCSRARPCAACATRRSPYAANEQRDAEDQEELDVALLVLAGSLHVLLPASRICSSLSSGVIFSLSAVDEVRVAEDLRAHREEVGVAGQPVERVLEDEDGAGDELLRVGPGEHEQLLVAAEARHHLPVLAHVRAVARARQRVREELRRREDEDARRPWRSCAGASTPCLSPSGNAVLSVPSTSARERELLLLQALELRRPLLERLEVRRLAGQVDRPRATSA